MRGRFAPSPSGRMHLGNIYSAVLSWVSVKCNDGEWILRIEDLDRQRCKAVYAEQIEDDLRWLGLSWDAGGMGASTEHSFCQSQRTHLYQAELDKLQQMGLLYPCFCSRADIMASSAPHQSDGMLVYSGKCRNLTADQKKIFLQQRKPAIRIALPNKDICFVDLNYGKQMFNLAQQCGDFIVQRADGNFAYQLAVVTDDALMGVTHVVRGCDLLSSTPQQIFLYQALGYQVPTFAHLPLLMSSAGNRLSKRDQHTDMGYLRQHYSAEQILGLVGFYAGIIDQHTAISLDELIKEFSWDKIYTQNRVVEDFK